jgi:hypothetical protein
MSRMQEASGAVECNYGQLANSIMPEANNQDCSSWAPEPCCSEGYDFGRARRESSVRGDRHPISREDRNGSETNNNAKSSIIGQTRAPDRQRRSHARSRSSRHKIFASLPLVQNENDSLDAQIRIFKEKEDLRECLIPGMVSGVSKKACEGWRRQAIARSAGFLARIKLGPCKDCKYFGESSASPAGKES